jgi:hypothetical protein
MTLCDSPAHLFEDCIGRPAARRTPHERNDAEVAREAAAVLHLDERPDPLETRLAASAADRPDVARHEGRRLLARPCDDGHVVGHPGECVGQIRGATGYVHARVGSCGAGDRLPRLPHRLVRDTAAVHDRNLGVVPALDVAVANECLAHLLRVVMRYLAAEEADREGRHEALIVALR